MTGSSHESSNTSGNVFKHKEPTKSSVLQACQEELARQTPSGVTSWGCHYSKKVSIYIYGRAPEPSVFYNRISAACVAGLSSMPQSDKLGFYIWHYPDKSLPPEIATWWLRFLLDPEVSPWKDVIRGQEEQDFDFVYKHGYVLTNLDLPSNLVANFLTAFRMSHEKPALISLWHKLHTEGCSHGSIATVSDTINYGRLNSLYRTQGHWPFQLYDADESMPDRINDGRPYLGALSNTFKTNASYLPCNAVWSGPTYKTYTYGSEKSPKLFDTYKNFIINNGVVKPTKRLFGLGEKKSDNELEGKSTTFEVVRDFCLMLDKDRNKLLGK